MKFFQSHFWNPSSVHEYVFWLGLRFHIIFAKFRTQDGIDASFGVDGILFLFINNYVSNCFRRICHRRDIKSVYISM